MPEKPIADHESKCTLGEDAREFIITQAKAAAREFNKRRKEVIQ